jgi:Xaa-Pro aminopeptidase
LIRFFNRIIFYPKLRARVSRLKAIQKRLRAEKLDGFLSSNPVNRNYVSGFSGSAGLLLVQPLSAQLLTDSRYWVQSIKELKQVDLVKQRRSLLREAADLIQKSGIKRLAVEAESMTLAVHEVLVKLLPKVELVNTQGWVEALREVKDPQEQSSMRQACRITGQAFEHILGILKPGLAEREVAEALERFMRLSGAEGPSFETIVASGPNGALPHHRAGDRKLKSGDLVVMDYGCKVGEYCSDFTRTVAIGKASFLQKKVHGIVRAAQEKACRAIRPGRSGALIDSVSRAVIKKAGYEKHFGHGLGHGVGREVHENPRLTPTAHEILKPGHAVTVEPGIYLPGKFGVRIEDLVLVTKKGHENLFTAERRLIEIG